MQSTEYEFDASWRGPFPFTFLIKLRYLDLGEINSVRQINYRMLCTDELEEKTPSYCSSLIFECNSTYPADGKACSTINRQLYSFISQNYSKVWIKIQSLSGRIHASVSQFVFMSIAFWITNFFSPGFVSLLAPDTKKLSLLLFRPSQLFQFANSFGVPLLPVWFAFKINECLMCIW